MSRTTIRGMAAGVVAALVLVACGADATDDKSGADGPPVTLRLGTEDDSGRPGATQIEVFAAEVERISEGQLLIEPVYNANGDETTEWDQVVARKVMSGELDMGMIPARAWDTEGVTSLRALHAPFLITSDELLKAVVADELADELLAGLSEVGVTGLALLPESLRHIFAFNEAPLMVSKFDGIMVRAPRSDTTYATFETLGAAPSDDDDKVDAAISNGELVVAEGSFVLAGTLMASTTAVGNLPLFPKINSLVMNTARYDALSEDQQAILREAARYARDGSIDELPGTADSAQEYCANGGRIVLAAEADLGGFTNAAAPVYRDLERDPATKLQIEAIRALKEELSAADATVPACGPVAASASPKPGSAGDFPDGVYRMEMTAEFLEEAGIDRPTAVNHAGIWTLFFEDGRFREGDCPGTYSVEGDRVTITLGSSGDSCGSAAGQVLFSAGWTLTGDQLQFTEVESGHGFDLLIRTLFGGRPFTKIE
jgi:TRAP-type C4-dicarboxylate transport system substrate-binding protein